MTFRTATPSGLHEFVATEVLPRYANRSIHAIDLGCGPGAMVTRLQSFGCEVVALDISSEGYEASAPHVRMDLDQPDFAHQLGHRSFDLVTAIEVIEHVESPIGFLRNVGQILSPSGVAVITTPNVDSVAAKLKFLLTGRIRTMDEHSDPTHISPIYFDLLQRQFLPRAALALREHLVFPPRGFQLSRWPTRAALRVIAHISNDRVSFGDHHVFILHHTSAS